MALLAAVVACGPSATPTEAPPAATRLMPTAVTAVTPTIERPSATASPTTPAPPATASPTTPAPPATAAPTPSERPATATSPTAEGAATGPPEKSSAIRAFVQPAHSPADLTEVASLLAVLPQSMPAVVFVKPQSVLQLPEYVSHIEDALLLLSRRTGGVLSVQTLSGAKISKAAFAISWGFPGGAVLSGDFPGATE